MNISLCQSLDCPKKRAQKGCFTFRGCRSRKLKVSASAHLPHLVELSLNTARLRQLRGSILIPGQCFVRAWDLSVHSVLRSTSCRDHDLCERTKTYLIGRLI